MGRYICAFPCFLARVREGPRSRQGMRTDTRVRRGRYATSPVQRYRSEALCVLMRLMRNWSSPILSSKEPFIALRAPSGGLRTSF